MVAVAVSCIKERCVKKKEEESEREYQELKESVPEVDGQVN